MRRAYRDPASYIVKVDGVDAVAIAVATNPNLDIVAVGDRVERLLDSLRADLPAGMELVALYQSAEAFQMRIS